MSVIIEDDEESNLTFISSTPVKTSKCRTQVEMSNFRHLWDINQFSVQQEICRTGDPLVSEFGDDDYEFILKLFPSGKDEECSEYLSIFLQIQKCPQMRLQFRVNFSIETPDGPRGCALNRNVVTINIGGIVTASKFFSIENLKSRAARYIPNDVLTISAELTVYGESVTVVDSEEPSLLNSLHNFPNRSTSSLDRGGLDDDALEAGRLQLKMLESGEYSDFTIKTADSEFAVHRVILASRSKFFEALFKSGHKEQKEKKLVTDLETNVVKRVLAFIYSGTLPDEDFSHDLVYAADRLMVDGLKTRCVAKLAKSLNVENVCSRLEMADMLNEKRLFNTAITYFIRHRDTVFASEGWHELRARNPTVAARVLEAAWHTSESNGIPPGKRRRMSNK